MSVLVTGFATMGPSMVFASRREEGRFILLSDALWLTGVSALGWTFDFLPYVLTQDTAVSPHDNQPNAASIRGTHIFSDFWHLETGYKKKKEKINQENEIFYSFFYSLFLLMGIPVFDALIRHFSHRFLVLPLEGTLLWHPATHRSQFMQ